MAIGQHSPVIDTGFASFENALPIVVVSDFGVDATGTPLKPIRTALGRANQPVDVELLGHHKRMDARFARDVIDSSMAQLRSDPVGFMEGLIQLEIDGAKQDNRRDVGPPITVLKIAKSGGAFVKGHEGACK